MDEATVTTAYNSLLNAMQAYHLAVEAAINARSNFEQVRLAAMRDGLITGKNEDERKMKTWEVLPDACRAVAVAELEERRAKYALDCAQVIVEQTRAQLRLEETKARVTVQPYPGWVAG